MTQASVKMPAWLDRGVLVYGAPKSGTTLFQNLLDGSGQLLAYPAELKLKNFVGHRNKVDDIVAFHKKSRIHSVKSVRFNRAKYAKLWTDALARREHKSLGAFIRFDALAVQQAMDSCAVAPEIWCAKDVGGQTDRLLLNWRFMFPEGKALFITRDPLMVTRAKINDQKRKENALSLLRIVRHTLESIRVVVAQAKYLNDPYVHILAYEDLVSDTAGTMAKVASFLGIRYSSVFETPTIFGEPQVVSTSSRKTTEVFASKESWTNGLTARERWIVSWTCRIASLHPRYMIDYQKLRARIGHMRAG